MVRAASSRVASLRLSRAFVGIFALLLVITLDGLVPTPAEAGTLGRQVALTRKSQVRVAARMRKADQQLKKIRRQRKVDSRRRSSSAKHLKRAQKRRQDARERRSRVTTRLVLAEADLDRRSRVRPNPLSFQRADVPKMRKKVKKMRARTRTVVRKTRKIERKATKAIRRHRGRLRRQQRKGGYAARIERNIRRRESAEDILATRIRQMVVLAQDKVARKTSVTPAQTGLKTPTNGYVSQRFGCTRVRKSKKGRRCVHFHDGVDIAARRGALVRASANGVVAYVGFNPWDRQKRAFMVLIAHRGGLITNYAHLTTRRKVKAGQYVRRGQTIGFVGVTGHTTGPHVHWEAIRNGRMLDPFSIG